MPSLIVPINPYDHMQGVLTAPITLVEYADYQCFPCKMTAPIIKQLQNELEGQMCFVFRHFPLKESHPYALMAAQTAEAAGRQNKFWEMHSLLYEKQMQMNPDLWPQLAEQAGLNMEKFKADFQDPNVLKKIQDDFTNGVRSGVNGTPCFYINGERYDGDPSYDSFKQSLIKAAHI